MENQPTPPQMNPPELAPTDNKPKFLRYLPYVIIPLVGGVVVFAAINFYRPKEVTAPTPTPTTNQEAQTPSPTETPAQTTQPKVGDISVNWLVEPVKVSPATLGLSIKDPNAYEGTKVDDIYTVWQVGTIVSTTFQNDKLYVIARACLGPCGSFYYRVVDDRGRMGLVLLTNLSNEMDQSDNVFFTESSQYDIPALRLPPKLSVQYSGANLNFEAEDFSPAAMFKDYVDGYTKRSLNQNIRHPQYGILYEETDAGYFIVKLPDGTVKFYRLVFPFTLSDGSAGFLMASTKLDLSFYDGSKFSANYTPTAPAACPPRKYDILKNIEGQLEKKGVFNSTNEFYELRNPEDKSNLSKHPEIYWKDVLGRWFRLKNMEFYYGAETECFYFDSVL